MHYVIIAAGEGSRLAQEGVQQPKPLVPLCGQPMIERLMDIFSRNDADGIYIIINEQMPEVRDYIEQWQMKHSDQRVEVLVQSTPSSMHSLAAICTLLPPGRFVCTTVDTVFVEYEFAAYASAFAQESGFLFGVTPYVDDEKPLWIQTDASGRIVRFDDQGPAPYVSGGIYGMDKEVIQPILERCLAAGKSRMRNFQRTLLEEGIQIRAHVFDKIMDIDHKSDINKAEQWLD